MGVKKQLTAVHILSTCYQMAVRRMSDFYPKLSMLVDRMVGRSDGYRIGWLTDQTV